MSLRYAIKGAERADYIRRQMKRTGLTPWGKKLWTKTEDDKVIRLYPDIKGLRQRLKSRSAAAIQQRAGALGVRRKGHRWKSSELVKLRKLFLNAHWQDILEAFPGLTKRQVISCAKYHGMKRNRKRFCKTGIEIIDAVREKAFQLNISMPDLDHMAGTKRYFSHAVWHQTKQANPKAVWRAIEALGGDVLARWND